MTPLPHEELPSLEEFQAMMQNPEKREEWETMLRRVLADEKAPENLRESVRHALDSHEASNAIAVVQKKMAHLMEVMRRPAGSMRAEDRLSECQQMADDIVDALLEMPERYAERRDMHLKTMVPLRDKLRAIQI